MEMLVRIRTGPLAFSRLLYVAHVDEYSAEMSRSNAARTTCHSDPYNDILDGPEPIHPPWMPIDFCVSQPKIVG